MDTHTEGKKVEGTSHGPVGIGGWLYLVIIGLVGTWIMSIIGTKDLIESFKSVTPELADAVPGIQAVLGFELLGQVFILCWVTYILVLMQRKSKKFPWQYIALFVFLISFNIIDVILIHVLDYATPELKQTFVESGNAVIQETVRTAVVFAIWGTYMRVSKRVKNTFVH